MIQANPTLAEFLSQKHRCDDWTLEKAIVHVSHGRYRKMLQVAAQRWVPKEYKHQRWHRIALAAGTDPEIKPLTRGQISKLVTIKRKEIEKVVFDGTLVDLPPQPPSSVDDLERVVSLDRGLYEQLLEMLQYGRDTHYAARRDILTAIWFVLRGPWGPLLRRYAKDPWRPRRQYASDWELELKTFIASVGPEDNWKPQGGDIAVYRLLVGKITTWLKTHLEYADADRLGEKL